MLDIAGIKLNIGDAVVYSSGNSLIVGVVDSFTPKKVRVRRDRMRNGKPATTKLKDPYRVASIQANIVVYPEAFL